ncbi:MAG: ribonuclease III [candidate division Zixibacteria bacterium]
MGIWESIKELFGAGRAVENQKLLVRFQKKIEYSFKDDNLLHVALTHRSFAKLGEKDWLPSNERLEFLGDSVLGLVAADYLFNKYPEKPEGDLTKFKALLVNETTLARQSAKFNLGDFILLSTEEEKAGGRERASILADAFEAVIGAIFIDGGLSPVRSFIERTILVYSDEIAADKTYINYKGELLEYLQARSEGMPRYEVVSEEGPDHHKTFTIEVIANGNVISNGVGSSKKDAEQKAAAAALRKLIEGDK